MAFYNRLSKKKLKELKKLIETWLSNGGNISDYYSQDLRAFFKSNKIKFDEEEQSQIADGQRVKVWAKLDNPADNILTARQLREWFRQTDAEDKVELAINIINNNLLGRFTIGTRHNVTCKLCAILDDVANCGIFFLNWDVDAVNYYIEQYIDVPISITSQDIGVHLEHIVVTKKKPAEAEKEKVDEVTIIDEAIRELKSDITSSRAAHLMGKTYVDKIEKLTQLLKLKAEINNKVDSLGDKQQLADIINIILANPSKQEDRVVEIVEQHNKDKFDEKQTKKQTKNVQEELNKL